MFDQIATSDRKSAELILNKIQAYAKNPQQFSNVKTLRGKFATFKRIRTGQYRIIFDEALNIMHIYHIKHRKDAYK